MPRSFMFVTITLATLLGCSYGAITERLDDAAALQSSASDVTSLPWQSLLSFINYFATSGTTSNDNISNQGSSEDSDSSETVIIYDVEEPDNSTKGAAAERSKRDLSDKNGEGRHKNVRPYPGFFLGRKLWYVPLWFSVYYAFYLTCLVVKSVARHRIHYPALVPADQTLERKRSRQKSRSRIADGIRRTAQRYRQY